MRFVDLQQLSFKVANWVESTLGLGIDDGKLPQIKDSPSDNELDGASLQHNQIGLMLGNTPEHIAFLLGIARVRAASVLFSTQHRRDSLLHAFNATSCRVVVFDSKYLSAIREIAHKLPDEMRFFMYDRNWPRCDDNNNRNDGKYNAKNYWQYSGMSKSDLIEDSVENFAPILDLYPTMPLEKKYSYEMSDNVGLEPI